MDHAATVRAVFGPEWADPEALATGEYHFTMHATHAGPWQGIEATGRTIAAERMVFFRFEGNLIAEAWELIDPTAIPAQISD